MNEIKEPTVMEAKEIPTDAPIKNVTIEVTLEPNTTSNIPATDSEFNRANIEALGSSVRLVDSDEAAGLDLFCYVRCGPTDEGLIRDCRGIIFHGQDLVMKAFPYTIEYNQTEQDRIQEHIEPVFKDCSIYDAHEGALIRMFNFGGKWYTSTHRKLNAFRSKWASRESFGTTLKRALEAEIEINTALRESLPSESEEEGILERFQSILDTTKQYMFLVRNTRENRIVCEAPDRPTLFHVGTFVDGVLVMTEDINLPYPVKHSFSSVKEMSNYVHNTDPSKLQGVIVFAPNNKQYKILNKDYQELFRARGNEPSIKFRYLQVRMNRKQLSMLYYLYPEMGDTFDEYENALYDIACSIYNAYVQRFMKKRYVSMPREEYAVMRECHTWHLEDRENNRMSRDKVIQVLNQQSPMNLNHMIRRTRTEDIRKNKLKDMTKNRHRSNTITSTSSPALLGTTPSPLLLTKNPQRNPSLINDISSLPPPQLVRQNTGMIIERVLSES